MFGGYGTGVMTTAFGDLLLGNQRYARSAPRPLQGIARAGVTIVTCMDSRLDPLGMVGLRLGDAKVIRTPGGHVTADAVVGCILSTHLLHVHRILVVQHTRCAMASGDDGALRAKVAAATGADLGSLTIGADPDQRPRLQADTTMLRDHPLLAEGVVVGGFLYDVDTARLEQVS